MKVCATSLHIHASADGCTVIPWDSDLDRINVKEIKTERRSSGSSADRCVRRHSMQVVGHGQSSFHIRRCVDTHQQMVPPLMFLCVRGSQHPTSTLFTAYGQLFYDTLDRDPYINSSCRHQTMNMSCQHLWHRAILQQEYINNTRDSCSFLNRSGELTCDQKQHGGCFLHANSADQNKPPCAKYLSCTQQQLN